MFQRIQIQTRRNNYRYPSVASHLLSFGLSCENLPSDLSRDPDPSQVMILVIFKHFWLGSWGRKGGRPVLQCADPENFCPDPAPDPT